ncbi:MAG: hypothetical protein LN568_03845 [Rickettsia endosymbiont of Pseudomimeciton antennatum]|nr:hypothetical protein [Rickettsia endosymbiont of Pseudomimeciton antennatum]MCC8398937.1 hypothetical protein [Rickettsia endosymbiont of Labidopullus appendiculatus]
MKQLFSELEELHNTQCSTNVTVVNVDSVVYDNPLLNNFELMKDVAALWEGNFNEVLKLSKELSQDLITE